MLARINRASTQLIPLLPTETLLLEKQNEEPGGLKLAVVVVRARWAAVTLALEHWHNCLRFRKKDF